MSQLPQGWKITSIADVTSQFDTIDPRQTPNKQFRYVDISSIDNVSKIVVAPKLLKGSEAPSRARRVIRTGDVLFSTVRTYLENIALVPPSLDGQLTSTGIAVLRSNSGIDRRYLFHWVQSKEFTVSISKSQDGTLYPAVTDKDVAEATVRLAPIAEQRRIVARIDSLSAKSKRARGHLDHIPRLGEKYKQAILAAAFTGVLTKIAPTAITKTKLGDFLECGPQNGLYLPKSFYGQGTPILRIQNFGLNEVDDVSGWQKVAISPEVHFQYALQKNDLVINRVNSPSHLGKSLIVSGKMIGAVFESNMMRARLGPDVDPKYVQLYLSSDVGRRMLTSEAKWAVNQASINQSDVKNTVVPLVGLEDQRGVVQRIEYAFTWIDRLAKEATSARKLIDALDRAVLAKAFRGDLLPQDPNDEPASVLLARIRAERATAPAPKRKRAAK